jgi:carbamoyl-phosphate synthase large subunit
MPLNKDIHKVLVIGSGPIVIGQAAEFDYAGAQACRALKEDGIEIVLLNSNPATIMTDSHMADEIYLEPLTPATVERIIEKEHPDAVLSGLGGQTGLNLSMQLAESGFLDSHNVRLLGSFPETIRKAEDREAFKETMQAIGQPIVPSEVVTNIEDAVAFADRTGYPVIVRPAFTLGGAGGGIAADEAELRRIGSGGIRTSPIGQILVETSVAGWKEIEFEVVRDGAGNAVTVCAMENFDPVGVHTGDSIVAAPTLTLADKEYQMLRTAALDIVNALGVEGGCNCQFALDPESFNYAVIEVNPRVSRSSALASKATGYPIARVAAKIALGYRLDEIPNEITGNTFAAFEPALDYVAVKFPKWPFDKFAGCDRTLGTQMKATGEVMAIADGFAPALMKAVRGAEIGLDCLRAPFAAELDDAALMENCGQITDRRLFFLFEALRRGHSVDELHALTKIDEWFLWQVKDLADYEASIEGKAMTEDQYWTGKRYSYPDEVLKRISGHDLPLAAKPTYKMVDTSAGEFAAETPYFYATFNTPQAGGEDEAAAEIAKSSKETVVVLGSGPIRIGQGIEFDYACVHAVLALRNQGFTVVMINNNPETVSTDFDTADRLYFEPLTFEDVMPIIKLEKPRGVVVAFGGQTAIRLTGKLAAAGIPILGTSASGIDMAEDRERFDELLTREHIARAEGRTIMTKEEALQAAHELTYPVLLRPSYVLGGQNMVICRDDETVNDYMDRILAQHIDNPVLVDKYIEGREIEVDAVYDGTDVLIPAIMEHVERTGIHSGDSIAICPALHIDDALARRLTDITLRLCRGLDAVGIANIQYILAGGKFYVIEVNPRASRTVPFLSKVTGIPLVDLAVRAALGEKLRDMDYGTGLAPAPLDVAVKVPVFSFEKMGAIDILLGPEMKSTGEVLGLGRNYREAIYKGLNAAGYRLPRTGGVFITVRDQDKHQVAEIARKFHEAGFRLYATRGTADVLKDADLPVSLVAKLHQPHGEDEPDGISLLESGKVNMILSTSSYGIDPARDSARLRRRAITLGIPCMTALDTANALADSLLGRYSEYSTELVDNNHRRTRRRQVRFVKMQSCGNDFIFLDGFDAPVTAPETLAVDLCDRRRGVGADGIVTLSPDSHADADMHMYNSDGSEGLMAANAMRMAARYLHDECGVHKKKITIHTPGGNRVVTVHTRDGRAEEATVEMGMPDFLPQDVPVNLDGDNVIERPVQIAGETLTVTCLSMGNPHCVVFGADPDGVDLAEVGPLFENDPLFPDRVNTEFVHVVDDHTLKVRTWERGSGATPACGTGACAAVVAACQTGRCQRGQAVTCLMPGGNLTVIYDQDGTVRLRGSAEFAFSGVVEL